jgi:hypothetical protein
VGVGAVGSLRVCCLRPGAGSSQKLCLVHVLAMRKAGPAATLGVAGRAAGASCARGWMRELVPHPCWLAMLVSSECMYTLLPTGRSAVQPQLNQCWSVCCNALFCCSCATVCLCAPLQAGLSDPDIFFTDRPRESGLGQRNKEYLSIWADDCPVLPAGPPAGSNPSFGGRPAAAAAGSSDGGGMRTPLQCYVDLMVAFREEFAVHLGTLIEEVVVGSGPCGELRYPSYVEANGWRFPGVGEFQCYDRCVTQSDDEAISFCLGGPFSCRAVASFDGGVTQNGCVTQNNFDLFWWFFSCRALASCSASTSRQNTMRFERLLLLSVLPAVGHLLHHPSVAGLRPALTQADTLA